MKTIELTYPHIPEKETLPETVAAIGFFDGIHKGHQKVIKTAVDEAKECGMESAVFTFHPHPSVVFDQNVTHVAYITPLFEKKQILEELQVDRLYIITFDDALASLAPQAFIDHFIIGLNIKHLVAGFDFTYGPKDIANMSTIGKHSRGLFTYTMIEKIVWNDKKVSSTAIRSCLKEGNIERTNVLLGRPFITSGKVKNGASRGHELGFPTANIDVEPDALLPKPGIYAVKVNHQGKMFNGMASLGTNPTFTPHAHELSLEVNILDFKENIYGAFLTVEWYQFIREEIEFADINELIKQMENDEIRIRSYFGK
ncbi:MAG TPA: riboflavin biosynthesis protein RibF [Virgibacillus sp.]|nr:riboflavin biosynthesis protein RibF [Virgibacillus sp.]